MCLGFVYDKQVEFEATEENDWDEDAEFVVYLFFLLLVLLLFLSELVDMRFDRMKTAPSSTMWGWI